ncbi:MAG: ion channel, partial [Acidobacteriaceae bacterium]
MLNQQTVRQIVPSRLQRLRARFQHAHKLLGGHYWFPHVPLAAMLVLAGYLVLRAGFGAHWSPYLHGLAEGDFDFKLWLLPVLLIGGGMITMGFGLLWRSRVAWLMALLLALAATLNTVLSRHIHSALATYFILILVLLLLAWHHFDRSSVAASTLFALTSVAMLLMYATFGAFYLGSEYKPPIHGLITALYYAMVTMSTVGYGDITPQTGEAK